HYGKWPGLQLLSDLPGSTPVKPTHQRNRGNGHTCLLYPLIMSPPGICHHFYLESGLVETDKKLGLRQITRISDAQDNRRAALGIHNTLLRRKRLFQED
ncbi:MAG: hypothetical protein R6T87_13615, partial [Marinobacter sp.]